MYCLAFAETHHGSDLRGVETRGDIVGDQIMVTGTKSWVTGADRADAALVLCRTAEDELSCVLVPLPDEAVELRPIPVMSGDSDLFELHFNRARAPLNNVVGQRGDGLRVAMRELNDVHWPDLEREFWELVQTARDNGQNRDPHVRQQLAWAYAQVRIIRALAAREPSVAKLVYGEYHRRLGEIAVDVTGSDGLLRPDGEAYSANHWQHVFLASRADTIANRTSEVQRDVMAEDLLGLPR
jgi:alkylation response protein AidB-like acyl-CoA dehydrogenase